MTSLILKDFSLNIDDSSGTPVDLSDHVQSVTLNTSADIQEDTAMGTSYKTRLGGLLDWSLDVTFKQDFAAAKVDATMFPILGKAGTFTGKPTSAAVGATNPSYSGECILATYAPIGNSVGDLATVSVTFQGNGTLTRAVA